MAKADFDNDGFDDIMWRNWSSGQLGYWDFNDVNGNYVWKGCTTLVPSAAIRIGDLGGPTPGASELFTYYQHTGTALTGVEVGSLGATSYAGIASVFVTAPKSFLITEGNSDFTNDGFDDFLYLDGNRLFVRDYNSATASTDIEVRNMPLSWEVTFTGDFTGDNFDDVLIVDQLTGYMGFLSGASAAFWNWTGLGYTTTEAVGDGWKVYGTGDFTNDGSEDILWFNQASNQVGFWDLEFGAWQGWVGLGAAGAGWAIVTTGDYTGDNFEDIVWRNTETGAVGLWDMNNASGSYNWIGLGTVGWNWDIAPA